MATSKIRHLAVEAVSDLRNSSAEANAFVEKPNSRSKSGKASRTD
jgi:hypothetical protein